MSFDGFVVLGPGSEWLWSMLQFLVVAISLVGLYRQLRESASQGAIRLLDTFTKEWDSPLMVRHRLDFLVSVQHADDPADVSQTGATALMNWWEHLGTLARRGDLDRKLLWDTYGSACQLWWALLAPLTYRERAELGEQDLMRDWEWLAGYCADMDKRHGGGLVFDRKFVAKVRDSNIVRLREQVAIERSLRAFVVLPSGEEGPVSA